MAIVAGPAGPFACRGRFRAAALVGSTGLLLTLSILVGAVQPAATRAAPPDRPPGPPPTLSGFAPIDFWRDVQPILEQRCAVCHGCYDAPCQLNLTAYEGLARGANKQRVYDTTRLLTAEPTRLFVDAQSVDAWRRKGFFPVLPESDAASSQAGLLSRMLALKRAHPLPAQSPLPASFDFSLNRDQQCPTEAQFDDFDDAYPLWGMPYGLPALSDREHGTLTRWLGQGAPYRQPAPLPPDDAARIQEWETFLNGESLKQQLMSRYLYEHLHLTHLHVEGLPGRRWFRLVRSRTAPGQPIELIATRRPYDDPGPARFYYRLEPDRASLLAKTHIPYALGPARKKRWQELFLDAPYDVRALPSYDPAIASNPFIAFQDLPVRSRYKFLLDDAQTFVMQFIKGPVCRGTVALDVIEDRFWLFFVDPDSAALDHLEEFLARESQHLYLPTEEGATRLGLVSWLKYSHMQNQFLQAKQVYLENLQLNDEAADLAFIWDGRGRNQNAALTVFRHADSASVVKGLVGDDPKTAWLLSYDLFERIYYLLVAGFDVYGFAGHQLDTRLYMDFLRMEGEFNFLLLLPMNLREKERDYWYRDAHQSVKDYVYGSRIHFDYESGIPYKTNKPKEELFDLLRQRLTGALNQAYDLDDEPDAGLRRSLTALARVTGRALQWMPEVAFLVVTEEAESARPERETALRPDRVYTLVHDEAYSNIASLFNLEARRLPDEDALTVVRGFVGAYPNAFYRVARGELPEFVAAVAALAGEEDYRKLADRFAVRRTDPAFWAHSDRLHEAYRTLAPLEAGLFDYNRLENR